MKKIILLSIVVLALIYSCGTTQSSFTRLAPKFDYVTPNPNGGIAKSNQIALALVRPVFGVNTGDLPASAYGRAPFTNFIKSMGNDFEEMLTARGYTIKGPFNAFDEMVYNEKKNTDLALHPEVDIVFTGLPIRKNFNAMIGKDVYWVEGEIKISGKINLVFYEPQTKTKVWVKSVPFEETTFQVKGTKKYFQPAFIQEEDGIWNPLVEHLEEVYQKSMKVCYNHLDPEELDLKKKEALEIKSKANFSNK
jgi:hypothetical protein